MDSVRTLLSCYLFQDLLPAELEPLVAACEHRSLAAGQFAFRNGDAARELFVVASGQLIETMTTPDGAQLVVEMFTAGAAFGEPALFVPERQRMADVWAMEPAQVLLIARDALVDFLFSHPQAILRMLEGLASGYRGQAEVAVQLAHVEIRQRLLSKLLELADTHGVPDGDFVRIELDIPQATLAGLIGASRENVNRALVPLFAERALVRDGRRVVVDVADLRRRLATGEPLLHRRNRAELARRAQRADQPPGKHPPDDVEVTNT